MRSQYKFDGYKPPGKPALTIVSRVWRQPPVDPFIAIALTPDNIPSFVVCFILRKYAEVCSADPVTTYPVCPRGTIFLLGKLNVGIISQAKKDAPNLAHPPLTTKYLECLI